MPLTPIMDSIKLTAVAFLACLILVTYADDLSPAVAQPLLVMLNEERQLRAKLDQEMNDLGSEIALLQQLQHNVTCGCPWHRPLVAFSASLTNDITSLGAGQQIAFDRVITNLGAGYDPRHGEFRAPVSGTYEFSVAILMTPAKWSGVEIVRDRTSIARVRSGDDSQWSMGTAVVTAQLQAGQDVWVEHSRVSDSNAIYGQGFSSFSGYLIQ